MLKDSGQVAELDEENSLTRDLETPSGDGCVQKNSCEVKEVIACFARDEDHRQPVAEDNQLKSEIC